MFATDGMDISNSNKMKFVAGYLELGQPWMVRVALGVVLYLFLEGGKYQCILISATTEKEKLCL